jgi:cytidine deaminase
MIVEIAPDILIAKAASIIKPEQRGPYLIGDVGCALVTDTNNIYAGVCIDTSSSLGFCAEHSAIAAMVAAGEYRIHMIVAVWKDADKTFVLAPCGRCREFMRQIHPDNLATGVILDRNHIVPLATLLPYHNWYQQIQIDADRD